MKNHLTDCKIIYGKEEEYYLCNPNLEVNIDQVAYDKEECTCKNCLRLVKKSLKV